MYTMTVLTSHSGPACHSQHTLGPGPCTRPAASPTSPASGIHVPSCRSPPSSQTQLRRLPAGASSSNLNQDCPGSALAVRPPARFAVVFGPTFSLGLGPRTGYAFNSDAEPAVDAEAEKSASCSSLSRPIRPRQNGGQSGGGMSVVTVPTWAACHARMSSSSCGASLSWTPPSLFPVRMYARGKRACQLRGLRGRWERASGGTDAPVA